MSEPLKQIKLEHLVNERLEHIVKMRKDRGHQIRSKQGVVADLINQAHRRELKEVSKMYMAQAKQIIKGS